MEDESVTDGRSSLKFIIRQPLPKQKLLGRLQDSSAPAGWSERPSYVVWESLHKALPSPSRPAPYVLTHWDESESTIIRTLCRQTHALHPQMFAE